jgi:hypothetical protein
MLLRFSILHERITREQDGAKAICRAGRKPCFIYHISHFPLFASVMVGFLFTEPGAVATALNLDEEQG